MSPVSPTGPQFQGLVRTALAEDGSIHGHGRTRNSLTTMRWIEPAPGTQRTHGRIWWTPTASGWRAIATRLDRLAEPRSTLQRTRYEESVAANLALYRPALHHARHRAHLRAQGHATYRPVTEPTDHTAARITVDLPARIALWSEYTPHGNDRSPRPPYSLDYHPPRLTPHAANSFMERALPLVQRLCDGWSPRTPTRTGEVVLDEDAVEAHLLLLAQAGEPEWVDPLHLVQVVPLHKALEGRTMLAPAKDRTALARTLLEEQCAAAPSGVAVIPHLNRLLTQHH